MLASQRKSQVGGGAQDRTPRVLNRQLAGRARMVRIQRVRMPHLAEIGREVLLEANGEFSLLHGLAPDPQLEVKRVQPEFWMLGP